jgi:hypothetical protein
MMTLLTPEGYEQAKLKLAEMEKRLAALEKRTDLRPWHYEASRKSYLKIMRQYLRDIKLYETTAARNSAKPDE